MQKILKPVAGFRIFVFIPLVQTVFCLLVQTASRVDQAV